MATASTTPAPEISVVIPTYRRETRLSFALDALAEQTLARDRFEVIVVRDSAQDPVTSPPAGLDVRFLTVSSPGPARRRNEGWRAARAPLVAFTDDDCRPVPEWLERLLAAADGELTIIEGRTEPDPDESHLNYGTARSVSVTQPSRWYPTCNLAMPRALLERLGGFDDETFAFFGEDTDLGLRAEQLGSRLVFAEDALVWHAVHIRSLRRALRDATERHSESLVVALHPSHRRELYLGAFVNEVHARWTLAALGLALWPRSRIAGAAAACPYLVSKVRGKGIRWRLKHPLSLFRLLADVLGETVVDGAEVVMRARSSLRYRQLVL